jgi:hypothetical protein
MKQQVKIKDANLVLDKVNNSTITAFSTFQQLSKFIVGVDAQDNEVTADFVSKHDTCDLLNT